MLKNNLVVYTGTCLPVPVPVPVPVPKIQPVPVPVPAILGQKTGTGTLQPWRGTSSSGGAPKIAPKRLKTVFFRVFRLNYA